MNVKDYIDNKKFKTKISEGNFVNLNNEKEIKEIRDEHRNLKEKLEKTTVRMNEILNNMGNLIEGFIYINQVKEYYEKVKEIKLDLDLIKNEA